LPEAHTFRVLGFLLQKSVNTQGRTPLPRRPMSRKSGGAIPSPLSSTPDHGFQKYVLELRAFQPTVNVRRGFGPRFARTKTTASASTPQAGSPLRLSHIQSVGWKGGTLVALDVDPPAYPMNLCGQT
jgi:hypothetical protein